MWSSFGSHQPFCQAGAQLGQTQTISQHSLPGRTARSTVPSRGAEPPSFWLLAECAHLLCWRTLGWRHPVAQRRGGDSPRYCGKGKVPQPAHTPQPSFTPPQVCWWAEGCRGRRVPG